MREKLDSGGWIRLHRQLLDNPVVMKDSDHLAVWIYILLSVQFEPKDVWFGGARTTLNPGQLTTGRKEMAQKLKVNENKIQRVLRYLESEQQIEQRTDRQCRLITVKNWSLYQKSEQRNEQRVNNGCTTSEQRVNTIYKERKNERRKEELPIVPLSGEDRPERWTDEEIQKRLSAGLKPYLEGDYAFYAGGGNWRVKTHVGWMDYGGSIIQNLTWK